ncbi:alpha/beta hydrolase [Microbulbifer sp. A4B17]|uniref:alpha/beta fold hydrolase n=1 Tax=Microbulbifer sp. A4B17 TaxID=359370 RepID=UPI000D52EE32|nr:alpha/beta hydrolase [Microbulbifer sp. A4B17]AWF82429.1 alpha/beta hydrolase [Microbulbifer sp. A4B17]
MGKIYVLVHGLFHGGWCWSRVAHILRGNGHRVFTPTHSGLGERKHLLSPSIGLDTFIEDLINMILWEELQQVTLVGHSFGGMAATGAADALPERIHRLIYLDGAVPESGRPFSSQLPSGIEEQRLKQAQNINGTLCILPPPPEALGITQPNDIHWLKRRMTPHPIKTLLDPIHLQRSPEQGPPCTFIHCTQPEYPPAIYSSHRAKQIPGWLYREVEINHDCIINKPEMVAKLLEESP